MSIVVSSRECADASSLVSQPSAGLENLRTVLAEQLCGRPAADLLVQLQVACKGCVGGSVISLLETLRERHGERPARDTTVIRIRNAARSTAHCVVAELGGVLDDVDVIAWFVSENEWLSGESPLERVSSDPDAVLAAARADRFIAKG